MTYQKFQKLRRNRPELFCGLVFNSWEKTNPRTLKRLIRTPAKEVIARFVEVQFLRSIYPDATTGELFDMVRPL